MNKTVLAFGAIILLLVFVIGRNVLAGDDREAPAPTKSRPLTEAEIAANKEVATFKRELATAILQADAQRTLGQVTTVKRQLKMFAVKVQEAQEALDIQGYFDNGEGSARFYIDEWERVQELSPRDSAAMFDTLERVLSRVVTADTKDVPVPQSLRALVSSARSSIEATRFQLRDRQESFWIIRNLVRNHRGKQADQKPPTAQPGQGGLGTEPTSGTTVRAVLRGPQQAGYLVADRRADALHEPPERVAPTPKEEPHVPAWRRTSASLLRRWR
jgi:hypothetical protein